MIRRLTLENWRAYEHLELEQGDDRVSDSGHGFGWEAGAGLVVPVGRSWKITPGARYRSLSRDVDLEGASAPVDLRFLLFDVGVTRGW